MTTPLPGSTAATVVGPSPSIRSDAPSVPLPSVAIGARRVEARDRTLIRMFRRKEPTASRCRSSGKPDVDVTALRAANTLDIPARTRGGTSRIRRFHGISPQDGRLPACLHHRKGPREPASGIPRRAARCGQVWIGNLRRRVVIPRGSSRTMGNRRRRLRQSGAVAAIPALSKPRTRRCCTAYTRCAQRGEQPAPVATGTNGRGCTMADGTEIIDTRAHAFRPICYCSSASIQSSSCTIRSPDAFWSRYFIAFLIFSPKLW